MFTLLPNEYKADLIKKYRARLLVVACYLIIFSIIFSGILLTPTFVFLKSEISRLTIEKESIQSVITDKNQDDFSKTLDNFKKDTEIVSGKSNTPSLLLEMLFSLIPPTITLDVVDYKMVENGQFQISVAGVASTRQELSKFASELRKQERFLEVNLPISDLAKEVKAHFNITIKGK